MFEGTRVREHVFERRTALKEAARTSPAEAGRGAKYTEFFKRRVSSAIYFGRFNFNEATFNEVFFPARLCRLKILS